MKVIGVTGGIGTGKSTVTSYIGSLGYSVIDADKIAHDVAKQTDVLKEIAEKFGDAVIAEDGQLDRKAMAEIVFSNAEKKNQLESIITRRVFERVTEFLELYRSGTLYAQDDVVFLDVPTLFETGADTPTAGPSSPPRPGPWDCYDILSVSSYFISVRYSIILTTI